MPLNTHSVCAGQPWMNDAACRGLPPTMFFPERGQNSGEAKRVCNECPVTAQCLSYGRDDLHGVWGGLSVKERRSIRRGRTA